MLSKHFFMRASLLFLMTLSFSSTIAIAGSSEGDQASAVMDRIVSASGGAAILNSVGAIKTEGDITAIVRGDAGRYERIWARGGRLRVETIYSRSTELRLLDGTQGWRGPDESSLNRATGPRLQAMLYQSLVLDLPFGIAERRYSPSYVGKDKFREMDVDVLKLEESSFPEVYVFVDDKGHIVKSMGMFLADSGKSAFTTSLSAEFDDFRRVDGLVLPFSVIYYARGMKIAQMNIDHYVLNPDITDVRFKPLQP